MPWARHEMHSLPVGLVGALVKDITVTFAFAVRTWKMGGLQICLIQYALYTFGWRATRSQAAQGICKMFRIEWFLCLTLCEWKTVREKLHQIAKHIWYMFKLSYIHINTLPFCVYLDIQIFLYRYLYKIVDLSFLQIVFAWEYWSQDDSSPVSLKSFGYPIDCTADVPFCFNYFHLHSKPSKPSKLSSIKKSTMFKKRNANLELLDSTSQVSLVELYWCILEPKYVKYTLQVHLFSPRISGT